MKKIYMKPETTEVSVSTQLLISSPEMQFKQKEIPTPQGPSQYEDEEVDDLDMLL